MTKEVNRLQLRIGFLFVFLVAALVVITLRLSASDAEQARLIHQTSVDRYNSCITRVGEINAYNARLGGPPGLLPLFPIPQCPPRP